MENIMENNDLPFEGDERIKAVVRRFIEDPKTVVFINHNCDIGEWLYSVQVDGTDLWLNSFDTEQEAQNWCAEHNLNMKSATE